MHSNTLTNLLKTFSAIELKEFSDFLKSPFYNKRNAVVNLYNIIVRYHPGYDSEILSKEKIFNKLFPGKKYKDATLRVLMHYLTELAEKYLVYSRVGKENFEYALLLNKELQERGQFKLLEKKVVQNSGMLEDADLDSEDYFYYKHRIDFDTFHNVNVANSGVYERSLNKATLENVFNSLTNFYLFRSMRMYLNFLTLGTMYNKVYKLDAYEKVFDNLNIDDYKNTPVLTLYYHIIKMFTFNNDETYFYKVKNILRAHRNTFNKFDLTGAYVCLNNYCTKKLMGGKTEFENERFKIFKEELIEKTYLMSDGYISVIFFRNVVTSGLNLGEYKWVVKFIENHKNELHQEFRDNYYFYCMAQCEFHMNNFERSLELNAKVEFDELYMKLNSRTLLMQLLYETEAEDNLLASLESFRHFLVNNKLIPPGRKLTYTNFYKYLKKISLCKNKKNETDAGLLCKNILNENNVVCKNWLIEKVRRVC